jgi:hypothetical protein
MNHFQLKPRGDRWELTESGNPVGSFATKEKALQRSTAIVSEVTGSLRIYKVDGTIEEELIYPNPAIPADSP